VSGLRGIADLCSVRDVARDTSLPTYLLTYSCFVPLALWLPGEAMAMRWQRDGHTFELGNEQLRAAVRA